VAGEVILNLIDSRKDLKAVFVFRFFNGLKIKRPASIITKSRV
jgi:hypothetical protein